MKRRDNKIAVSSNIMDNQTYMKKRIGLDVSFDLGFREITLLRKKVQLYYVTGLCDSVIIQEILETLIQINDNEANSKKLKEIVNNRLVHQQVEEVETMDEVVDNLLSGLIIVFVNGEKIAFVIDVRNYPGRTPEEPDTERVIRGSRDGYTENIVESTALTRRRIRDARLRNEMLKVGERSKTDVCVTYLEDVADDGLVKTIKDKIEKIEVDGITMADKTLEEFIIDRKWSPYPLVRYTERPDVAASHLLEGHVIVFVDTSPSAIILPTTFFHHMQHAEEYREAPLTGTFIRLIRFIAVFISLYLLPVWLLFVIEPTFLPKELAFIGPNDEGNIPITYQIILGIIGLEFLRMAAIHTPTPLATAMGLIAAVLIGQIAIDVGMFGPEVILYISVSAIGSYVTPSYELSVANKLINLGLVLAVGFFGVYGLTIGVLSHLLFLIHLRSIKTPYLWPFIPFNPRAMLQIIFRVPKPYSNSRPSIVHPKNNYSQPIKKS
ncbi:spore germination protein [Virgibacillus halodenitrificans]|uniref:Spore germination protein n=1 Tax=Virgibacillus halodenitrificans TaxID=1482 RepID=A0ABR7VL72_VIRHA|nr:spore germination protein [Virgibacillus halodenitrificans]MBD1222661.1 spore germination protein [Virgibacillus halodenitrificans]MCG1028254.1 spore germination protein [Virgibacillus halodenitrificans]MCJ0930956.1 spore germination protein [Virgibacillus halodenitrificans]MYL46953.1 spore germination protein [Virgibacillus halodenitrificans]MYL57697.1 spore germination protein [Virgibacillus halodenitrificans]